MQDILKRFELALSEQDLRAVRMSVEELLRLYVPKNASPELKTAICEILQRKAAESSNRSLTSYLRAVAECVQQFQKAAEPSSSPQQNNRLGSYLNDIRK